MIVETDRENETNKKIVIKSKKKISEKKKLIKWIKIECIEKKIIPY